MTFLQNILRPWLPIAILATAICALTYLLVQQAMRHAANDPQIQWAEDAAKMLSRGAALDRVASSAPVEIADSLAPFLTVYNSAGDPIQSSAWLHGRMPHLPPGIFEYVRQHGEERVTWQPERGVRMAAVVTLVPGRQPAFVMSARSLRETEKRIAQIGSLAFIAWLAMLGATFIVVAATRIMFSAEPSRRESSAVAL